MVLYRKLWDIDIIWKNNGTMKKNGTIVNNSLLHYSLPPSWSCMLRQSEHDNSLGWVTVTRYNLSVTCFSKYNYIVYTRYSKGYTNYESKRAENSIIKCYDKYFYKIYSIYLYRYDVWGILWCYLRTLWQHKILGWHFMRKLIISLLIDKFMCEQMKYVCL